MLKLETKDAIIIQMYNVKIEEKMVKVIARQQNYVQLTVENPFSIANYLKLCIVLLVSAAYAETQRYQ